MIGWSLDFPHNLTKGSLVMGMTRKVLSVCTLGLIDFRSDKERTARYTKQTRDAARAQAKAAKKTAKEQQG
jgi:hypothetical protein